MSDSDTKEPQEPDTLQEPNTKQDSDQSQEPNTLQEPNTKTDQEPNTKGS